MHGLPDLADRPAHVVRDEAGGVWAVRLAQQPSRELAAAGEVEPAHLLRAIREAQRPRAVLERVGAVERLSIGRGHQRAERLADLGMHLRHRLGHEHLQRRHRRALAGAHELHELALPHAEADAAHLVERSLVHLGKVVVPLAEEVEGEALRQLVRAAVGVELLALEHGRARHAQAVGRVVPPVLAAEVAAEHRLDEQVQAQAVAERVEHGEADRVAPVGHVDVVPVCLGPAHGAQLPLGYLEGQRVLGVEEVSLALHQGVGEVGHAGEHVVHGFLQDVSPHVARGGDVHHVAVARIGTEQVRDAAEVLLLEGEFGLRGHGRCLPLCLVATVGILPQGRGSGREGPRSSSYEHSISMAIPLTLPISCS